MGSLNYSRSDNERFIGAICDRTRYALGRKCAIVAQETGKTRRAEASTPSTKRKNPFVVATRGDGDNHSRARNIRNSISLTIPGLHRIISRRVGRREAAGRTN
jgi:hypothetical protein